MKTSELNSNGLLIEVGKTYYYYNIGLGEIKTHTVKYVGGGWAVADNGKVWTDSLYATEEDCKEAKLTEN